MTLADYGYGVSYEGSVDDGPTLSLEESATRKGYRIRASVAAAGMKARLSRLGLSATLSAAGMVMFSARDTLVSAETAGGWLLTPISLYLIVAGLFWMVTLLRRPQELEVNHGARCFHLIRRTLSGKERSRETIRFEEVVKIAMIDHLPSLDMRASAMNWDMGRIDITWRKDKVSPMVIGDVAELEPLLRRLRREVGMA